MNSRPIAMPTIPPREQNIMECHSSCTRIQKMVKAAAVIPQDWIKSEKSRATDGTMLNARVKTGKATEAPPSLVIPTCMKIKYNVSFVLLECILVWKWGLLHFNCPLLIKSAIFKARIKSERRASQRAPENSPDFNLHSWVKSVLRFPRGGLMVSALNTGWSDLGLSPGLGSHSVVFLGRHFTLTVPLSTQDTKCWG